MAAKLGITSPRALADADQRALYTALGSIRPRPSLTRIATWQEDARSRLADAAAAGGGRAELRIDSARITDNRQALDLISGGDVIVEPPDELVPPVRLTLAVGGGRSGQELRAAVWFRRRAEPGWCPDAPFPGRARRSSTCPRFLPVGTTSGCWPGRPILAPPWPPSPCPR